MFGHPLHPIAVHLPITLLFFGVLIDFASIKHETWRKAGLVHLVLGVIGAAAAVLTGNFDARGVGSSFMLDTHRCFANGALIVFAIMAVGRIYFKIRYSETNIPTARAATYLVLGVIGVGLLVATGFTGGELVYGQGIGTAVMR